MLLQTMMQSAIQPGMVSDDPIQHFPADCFPTVHPIHWLHSHFAVGGWRLSLLSLGPPETVQDKPR